MLRCYSQNGRIEWKSLWSLSGTHNYNKLVAARLVTCHSKFVGQNVPSTRLDMPINCLLILKSISLFLIAAVDYPSEASNNYFQYMQIACRRQSNVNFYCSFSMHCLFIVYFLWRYGTLAISSGFSVFIFPSIFVWPYCGHRDNVVTFQRPPCIWI